MRTKKPISSIIERDTIELYEDNYRLYGSTVLQDRSLPDYRDGLLKVHRRVLWSMHNIAKANAPFVKSARVVGDVLGKYHPHGDTGTYGAMQTMALSYNNTIEGSGNWGSQTDAAAAYRYSNCRLSEYATSAFFDKRYMPTVKYHPNYDGKDIEPELLPALLPNVLMNGPQGIAVGLATNIPSFEKEGLIKILQAKLKGKKVTTKMAKQVLKFAFPFGGNAPLTEEWQENADSLIETGKGSIYAYCEYNVDKKKRVLHITAVPPRMNPEKLIENLQNTGYFTTVVDCLGRQSETHADIVCTFKRGANMEEIVEELEGGLLYSTIPYQIAVVERYYNEEVNAIKADIYQWGILELLDNWLEWRLELEGNMLQCLLDSLAKTIAKKNLLLLAQENRKLLAQSWEETNQFTFVKAKLKLTDEDTKYVLALNLSQLSKLDREKLKAEIKDLETQVKATKTQKKDLHSSVSACLENL